MNAKTVAQQQYRRLANNAAAQITPERPPEGWLRTVRLALGMSGAQLAARMGVTRARIAQAEQAELSGAATLRSMQAVAEALGCKFVYAVVPDESIDNVIAAQARKKATTLVGTASTHMALEGQALPEDKIAREVTRLSREIAREMPADLWNDR